VSNVDDPVDYGSVIGSSISGINPMPFNQFTQGFEGSILMMEKFDENMF
jgi:hypothetical protein